MKTRTVCMLAVLALVVSFGCTKDEADVGSALEDAKSAVETTAESAGELVDDAKDAVDEVTDTVTDAKEAVGDAVDSITAFKDEMAGKIGDLEGKLEWMKQMSGSLNNEELTGVVTDLDGKLSSCKSKFMGMESLGADEMMKQKDAVTSEISELTGMFGDAESKIKEMQKSLPGGVKIPG